MVLRVNSLLAGNGHRSPPPDVAPSVPEEKIEDKPDISKDEDIPASHTLYGTLKEF